MFLERSLRAALLLALATAAARAAEVESVRLQTNDIVAFVGGSDVAAAQFAGHTETLLTIKYPGVRFRNLGWEGDTIFVQPRDFGFPPPAEHLKRAGVTVVFLEFGRAEALSGKQSSSNFLTAYEKLVDEIAKQTARIVLITPPPFENGSESLPDLSSRNDQLALHANAIRALARQRSLPLVDLFAELRKAPGKDSRLTDDGFQLTSRGHGLVANAYARQLGLLEIARRAGALNEQGIWSNQQYEKLRRVVIEKNQLWFNYWRPQNWAFLGGDRTTQPSSRDHRDPKVRWFPAEMEKYVPLILAKEKEMEELAVVIGGGVK